MCVLGGGSIKNMGTKTHPLSGWVWLPRIPRIVSTSGRNRVKLLGGPYPGADTGFPEGGGGEDIHKHPPPLDIVRVTSSALRKIEKHPHYNILL